MEADRKAFFEDIKELREKMINENNELLLATFIGKMPPVIPDMEFTYPDPEIHDDLYKLIEFSCREICSGEELKKVLNIWTSFVEPMLEVPNRNENGVEDDISNGNLENAGNSSGVASSSTRQSNAGGLVGLEMGLNAENLISLEHGNEAIEANEHANGSVGPLRVEREEGELSPNGDFEEDNSATHGNADMAAAQVPNRGVPSVGLGENNANNEGVGSDPRLIEESEHASENGGESNDAENNEGSDHDENENKVESEGEAEVEDEAHGDICGLILPSLQSQFRRAKPISKRVIWGSQLVRERDSRLFYGNELIYVLLRLHQVLYERIRTVKAGVTERDRYSRFLSALYNLLNGSCDNAKFEDECRAIIGTQSYILFTLDRLVFKIVKQLQAIATDELTKNMFHLYAYENSRRPYTFDEAMYHDNTCALLQEEYVYRIECLSSPTRLSIQLLENCCEKSEEKTSLDPKFGDYVDDYLSSTQHKLSSPPIFLKTNMCKYPGNKDEQYPAALDEVQIKNSLEIRMTQTSLKMRYVLGTEDVLYKSRQKNKNVNQNGLSYDKAKSSNKFLTRAEKFNMWLSSTIDGFSK